MEPVWKMICSNKAILPVLWELFPGHPNLLPASFTIPAGDAVAKPLLSREGANVSIRRGGTILAEREGNMRRGLCLPVALSVAGVGGRMLSRDRQLDGRWRACRDRHPRGWPDHGQ